MRISLLLTFTFACLLSHGELLAQPKEATIEDLKWIAVVSESSAEFIFPPSTQSKWSWNNAETLPNRLEYNWNVDVGEDEQVDHFQFGPVLFKAGAEAVVQIGSLVQLLEACQHDLWKVDKDGGHNIGPFGKTDVVDNHVRVTLSDKKMIAKIFINKPAHVFMSINSPNYTIRMKVPVRYEKSKRCP